MYEDLELLWDKIHDKYRVNRACHSRTYHWRRQVRYGKDKYYWPQFLQKLGHNCIGQQGDVYDHWYYKCTHINWPNRLSKFGGKAWYSDFYVNDENTVFYYQKPKAEKNTLKYPIDILEYYFEDVEDRPNWDSVTRKYVRTGIFRKTLRSKVIETIECTSSIEYMLYYRKNQKNRKKFETESAEIALRGYSPKEKLTRKQRMKLEEQKNNEIRDRHGFDETSFKTNL